MDDNIHPVTDQSQVSAPASVGVAARSSKKPTRKMIIVALLIVVVLVATGVAAWVFYNKHNQSPALAGITTKSQQAGASMNQAIGDGNMSQALTSAKEALSYNPDNIDEITAVANLESTAGNKKQAQYYYLKAFNEFKKQQDPDGTDATTLSYWAAATMAQQAGQTAQAKHYYQEVVNTANSKDSYEQSLVAQSKTALKGLSS